MKSGEILFSVRDVARILDINESRIRYWAQTGFINPTGGAGGRRLYTFRDLVALRAARELLDGGLPLQRARRSLQALREALPGIEQPLSELRVLSDGERVIVAQRESAFEPLTGQLLLDFELGELRQHAASVVQLGTDRRPDEAPVEAPAEAPGGPVRQAGSRLTRGSGPPAGPRSGAASPRRERELPPDSGQDFADEGDVEDGACAWFLRACQLEDAGNDDPAEGAYRKALELDPTLAAALTNLGNIHHRRGEHAAALSCYEQACALEPDQPETLYNIANLYGDDGDFEMAISQYRRVIALAPDLADAHFNLALALEQVGSRVRSGEHWRRYLELARAPEAAEWVAEARKHLRDLDQAEAPKRAGARERAAALAAPGAPQGAQSPEGPGRARTAGRLEDAPPGESR